MIELNKNNQIKINKLLSNVPDDIYKSIHLKIEGNKAEIHQVDINDNIAISFNVELEDINIDDIFYCSIPNTKKIINHLFSGKYNTIILYKEKIVCKDNKKEISVSLLDIGIDDISTFPNDDNEMFNMLIDSLDIDSDEANCSFTLEQDELKDIIELFSFVDVKKDVKIQLGFNKNVCMFNVKDILENNIKYKITNIDNNGNKDKIIISFDYYLYSVLKYFNRKEYNNSINVRLTDKFIILSMIDNDITLIYSLSCLNEG